MDQLYTIEEIQGLMKVSRPTLYRYMDEGIIPFVQIGGQRRFIGSQVMTAIKRLQVQQVQARLRGNSSPIQAGRQSAAYNGKRVRNYTLWDVLGYREKPTLWAF